ncbi:MAG: hypothetical protein ACI8S6_004740 [Myxococcota bacterium]|jgi:hypothetical protein
MGLWVMMVVVGCMEHGLSHVGADDPEQYQATVLDYMCSQSCEWQDVDDCWEQLSGHWAFCLDGSERLDPALVEDCTIALEEKGSGECSYLPEECLVSSVVLGGNADGGVCAGVGL